MITILTALDVEYAAVRAHLTNVEQRTHERSGTRFDVGVLAVRPNRRVALATTGMGNINAAVLAQQAVEMFRLSAMMFVGVAGGLRDWLELGDVVVGTRVYSYHGGKSTDEGFLVRPRAWDISHRVEQVARVLARTHDWYGPRTTESPPPPTVHFAPIAAGDVVVDSKTSGERQRLRESYNDAVAVEMESAGFAAAGHVNDAIPTVTIRGVSDDAGGEKEKTDGKGWQRTAATNAAAFAAAVAADLDDTDDADVEDPAPTPTTDPRPEVHNIAKDNARVGYQLGIVHGGIRTHQDPRDRT